MKRAGVCTNYSDDVIFLQHPVVFCDKTHHQSTGQIVLHFKHTTSESRSQKLGGSSATFVTRTASTTGAPLVMTFLNRSPLLRTGIYVTAIGVCVLALLVLPDLEPDHTTLTMHGLYDWIGHGITALIVAIGVRAMRLPIPVWSILVGGIIIDVGHIPQMMGHIGALEGSTRNGSHSLAVVATLAMLGFLDRRRAHIWLGIAMGAVSHLWRDMGTGTVALMWPITDTVYGTTYNRHLAVLAGIAIAMVGTAGLLDAYRQSITKDNSSSVAL